MVSEEQIIAEALLEAVRVGHLSKLGIDEIRGAVIGYCAASPSIPHDIEAMVTVVLRKVVEGSVK